MAEALIAWGGWDGHEPEACAGIVAGWLREEGFSVRIAEGTAPFAEPGLGAMDLVVPMITMSRIAPEEIAGLALAVEAGTGLAGFHGQMGDSFRDCVEYQVMVGGQFVAHPGNIIDYRVEIERPDHPITRGMSAFPYRSEQYYMHVDPSNEVLATTRLTGEHASWAEGVVMPVAWTRRHGEGRVFYTSLGHVSAELEHPRAAELLRRGLVWAARGTGALRP